MDRMDKIMAAVSAALAAAAIGGGIAIANATQTPVPPPPPPTSVVDTSEPGDTPDVPGAPDTDSVQEGDQNGPGR
jgi:hypothetical protein